MDIRQTSAGRDIILFQDQSECLMSNYVLSTFGQLLGQPFVSRQLLIAAATVCRGLRGLAGQLLQAVHLGLERIAFRFERVPFGGQRVPLRFERVPLGGEVGDNFVRPRLVRSGLISGELIKGGLVGGGLVVESIIVLLIGGSGDSFTPLRVGVKW